MTIRTFEILLKIHLKIKFLKTLRRKSTRSKKDGSFLMMKKKQLLQNIAPWFLALSVSNPQEIKSLRILFASFPNKLESLRKVNGILPKNCTRFTNLDQANKCEMNHWATDCPSNHKLIYHINHCSILDLTAINTSSKKIQFYTDLWR